MGHHGIWGKGNGSEPLNMLEESIRVPLILNHPGLIAGGQIRAELVNHCDLFMSLLDFADATPKALDQIAGKSYRHLLDGGDDLEWDNTTIVEYGNVRAIRDARYKLVQRYDGYENLLHDLRKIRGRRKSFPRSTVPEHCKALDGRALQVLRAIRSGRAQRLARGRSANP